MTNLIIALWVATDEAGCRRWVLVDLGRQGGWEKGEQEGKLALPKRGLGEELRGWEGFMKPSYMMQ